MKVYNSVDEIKKAISDRTLEKIKLNETKNNNESTFGNEKEYNNTKFDELENYDKLKTKVLKYVVYKKRTENEIIQKFSKDIDEDTLYKIIDELKENKYINDNDYIKRSVNEFMSLRNLSMWEIKYKLMSKGIKGDKIDDYFSNNYETLIEYEKKSAENIVRKKKNLDTIEIKKYLIKKGYKEESIREALDVE